MCDHVDAVAHPSVHQTLDELEFERSLCNAGNLPHFEVCFL